LNGMGKRLERIVVWATLLFLMVGLLPATALASAKPGVTLDQAIQAVKGVFEVPGEFTQFSSGYNQYEDRQAWNLNWRTTKEPGGNMWAEVDAVSGDILGMNIWQYTSDQPMMKLPSISREEAVKIAQELVNRLHSERLDQLSLQPGDGELLPLMSWGPATYNIRWQRLVNGIPFPEDGVNVSVDTQSGKVTGYYFRWTKGDFPTAINAITVEQARQAFDQAEMFSLQYFRPYPREPRQQVPALLVYRLGPNAMIDALTGEPVNLEGGWMEGGGGMGSYGLEKAMGMDSSAAPVPVQLTPEELKEVEESAKILSQEDAEAVVRQWVHIPANMVLRSINLYSEDWQDPGLRTWNFHWNSDERESRETGYRYLSARVNAITGELLSFDRDRPWIMESNTKDGKSGQRLNRAEAQKVAEEFLAKIQPERFKQVKQQPESRQEYYYYGPLGEGQEPLFYSFQYLRLVDGITFPANGLSATVDTATGEITSYYMNWFIGDFPSTQGIMDLGKATDRFLARQPLTLQYTMIYKPYDRREIRLVYRPVPQPGSPGEAMTDAKTGEPLDWSGQPLAQQPRPYRFTDIDGHWAEKEISLLGQAGVFGEYGETFRPGEAVTAVQLLKALLVASDGVWGIGSLTDNQVLDRARQRGWVKEDLQPGDAIDRQMLARLTVRFLGLDRAARVKGIYTVPFTDVQSIANDSLGYVALSWGLGVLKGDNGKFRPADQVSRAEAAVALVRTLGVER